MSAKSTVPSIRLGPLSDEPRELVRRHLTKGQLITQGGDGITACYSPCLAGIGAAVGVPVALRLTMTTHTALSIAATVITAVLLSSCASPVPAKTGVKIVPGSRLAAMKAEAADRLAGLELIHSTGLIAQSEIDQQRQADARAFAEAVKSEAAQ